MRASELALQNSEKSKFTMSDIVDDLLLEVEQLEESTQELDSSVKKATNQASKASNASSNDSLDSNLIALEAAKTAQEASQQSHNAAQMAIKQAESLKSQALELSDANFNWRHAVNNASKEMKAAKGSFTVMLVTSIVFSLIALGAMGYLFYSIQKQQASFKGEVLDIISTENTLLNKKVTLKIDELASVVEMLEYRVSKLDTSNTQTPANTQEASDSTENEVKLNLPVVDKEAQAIEQKEAMTEESSTSSTPSKEAQAPEENQQGVIVHQNPISDEQVLEIKGLIEQVLAEQKKLKRSDQQTTTMTGGLTSKQIKKLNDISWLVRKQDKTLKAIEARLGVKSSSTKSTAPNKTVFNELKSLQKQQHALHQQMLEMQATIKKYTEEPKAPPPYSYKAK